MNLIRPRSEIRTVRSDIDGKVAGWEREHWDDRQDAKALLRLGRFVVGDTREAPGLYFPGYGVLRTIAGVAHLPIGARPIARRDGRLVPEIAGGAFASGLYVDNFIDVLDATQLAIDLSLDTHKWALYTNTLTPDFSTEVSYSATNEISGTGYTAGGRTIAAGGGSPTTTESPAGSLMYDQNDMTWPTASFTARGAILYADALTNNNLIVASNFGADITATAATFTIAWASTGVFAIDLTP